MALAANEQSRDWDAIADDAKSAVASAVAKHAHQLPPEQLLWAGGIAERMLGYLAEDAEAA